VKTPAPRRPRSTRYFVYILLCVDHTLYIGITNHLARRLDQHNNSKRGARYTRGRRPVVLKYAEPCRNLSAALKREAALKRLPRAKKLALIHLSPLTLSSA